MMTPITVNCAAVTMTGNASVKLPHPSHHPDGGL